MRELEDRPKVYVRLVGQDGNAFSIIGRCIQAMRRAHWEEDEIAEFRDEATSGDYHHVLQTAMKYCEEEEDAEEEYDDDDIEIGDDDE